MGFPGAPEPFVSRCRARIEQDAPPIDRDRLMVATQCLLALRDNEDPPLLVRLRALLGGLGVMIESPLYQEIVAESQRKGATETLRRVTLKALVNRFGEAAKARGRGNATCRWPAA